MSDKKLALPEALEPYRERFEATIKPAVKINTELAVQDSFFGSTFGGYPYLPNGFEFPKDSEGNLMTLLAQINWEQVPPLEDFPRSGITQFYIARRHDLYGLDLNAPREQKDWRVLHFPQPDRANHQIDFSFLGAVREYYHHTPFEIGSGEKSGNCLRLSFKKIKMPVTTGDYQFDSLICENSEDCDFWSRFDDPPRYEIWEEYDRLHDSSGDKIGGYADFTQQDPRIPLDDAERDAVDRENPWLLLLQIDSGEGICWGDVGIANFFIRRRDLQNLDFSDVWYNWDCC